VVVPAYNAENTIEKCLTSVLNQTYTNYEIIIVNDGSTDVTLPKCVRLLANASVEYKIIDQENGGPSLARNAGIREARGEYIAFLDADDAWVREKVSISLDVFRKIEGIAMMGTPTKPKAFVPEIREITFRKMLFKNYFLTSSVVGKKSALEGLAFDESLGYGEDFDFWMQILRNHRAIQLNRSLTDYGDGKRGFGVSGLSKNLKAMQASKYRTLTKYYRKGEIGLGIYSVAMIFATIKYVRRIVITKIFA
jgi:glycosyltransferase involved in cell wall biosynthesis